MQGLIKQLTLLTIFHSQHLYTACWIFWQTGKIEGGSLDMYSLMVKNNHTISNVPVDMLSRYVRDLVMIPDVEARGILLRNCFQM